LRDIAQDSFGTSSLPNNEEGRRFLRAYLLRAMPAAQALALAPWSRDGGEFFRIVELAEADRRRRAPHADRLGELIEFSFDQLRAMKRNHNISIKFVAPFDAQPWQIDEFWESQRRDDDRKRKQRERKRESNMPTLTRRAKIVREALSATHWISVSDIMDAVVLRDQRKRRLAPDGLRSAVKRALDELVACGLVESRIETGEHGVANRVARRAHMTGPVFVHVDKALSEDVSTQ
jgi:hypothetical protein